MTDLTRTLMISAAGMNAQSMRLRVAAENMANQDTAGLMPGAPPYKRKTVSFESRLDKAAGTDLVRIRQIGRDRADPLLRYDPSNPLADGRGYVQLPNVNPLIEMMDMRDAERAYSANLAVMHTTRGMLTRTIEMLK